MAARRTADAAELEQEGRRAGGGPPRRPPDDRRIHHGWVPAHRAYTEEGKTTALIISRRCTKGRMLWPSYADQGEGTTTDQGAVNSMASPTTRSSHECGAHTSQPPDLLALHHASFRRKYASRMTTPRLRRKGLGYAAMYSGGGSRISGAEQAAPLSVGQARPVPQILFYTYFFMIERSRRPRNATLRVATTSEVSVDPIITGSDSLARSRISEPGAGRSMAICRAGLSKLRPGGDRRCLRARIRTVRLL